MGFKNLLSLFAILRAGESRAWPSSAAPNLEISLEPPPASGPSMEHGKSHGLSLLGNLDRSNQAAEATNMANIVRSYNNALQKLQRQIRETVGRVITGSVSTPSAPLSMLRMKSGQSHRGEEFSVKIQVLPELGLSPAIEENVANLAKKRSQEEKDFIEKAVSDMSGLASWFSSEVERQLLSHAGSFAKASPHKPRGSQAFLRVSEPGERFANKAPIQQANVRVVASDAPYPTISSQVQDLETHRELGEDLAKTKILAMQLNLLKVGNLMLKQELVSATQRVQA